MKTKIFKIFLPVLLFACSAPAVYAGDMFPELEDRNDVETVFVSKSLISGATAPLGAARRFIGNSLANVESVSVYQSDSKSGMKACKDAMRDYQKQNPGLEVLMRSRDGGDLTLLCGEPIEGSDAYSRLIIYTVDDEDVCIVVLTGRITLSGNG